METRISIPSTDRPFLEEDLTLTVQSRTFLRSVYVQALILGDGSPEGVIEAEMGATYQDNLGTTGAIRYAKRDDNILGDKTKGWILI